MNSFGRIFRISIYGESHGEAIGIVVDGCPAGVALDNTDFTEDLRRRRPSTEGTTNRKESDVPIILSGLFKGKTTGAPIHITFENTDIKDGDYEAIKDTPRPGHADFAAYKKYGGFNDFRGGGYFSGRLTVALVAAGVIAKKIIEPVDINARLIEAGGIKNIGKAVARAKEEKDSIGGIVECRTTNIPSGLGEPFFDSVESLISHLTFSIPAVKAIEFGSGIKVAKMRGSENNDPIIDVNGKTETNHAGGITGGITNGNDLIFRLYVKPTPSIEKPQRTVNLKTGKPTEISIKGRHDVCIALRVPVIAEAAAAIVLTDLLLLEQKIPRIFKQ
jgi:chorismate synthase